MRSTKRKNSATNSGGSVLSFFEQPIKPNDTKRQRLNKLVTRQAMEIKLPQKENEALRMENEIFKEATDKHLQARQFAHQAAVQDQVTAAVADQCTTAREKEAKDHEHLVEQRQRGG